MADKVEDKMKTLVDIKFVFDNFVQKYKEICIDKIWIPESKNVNIDNFVNDSEIPVDSSDNCLDGLNDVGAIIDRLFDSEKNFITQMEADIKNFNKNFSQTISSIYFVINASAESFNTKIKAFRAQFRAVRNVGLFFYRLTNIFA